MATTSLVDVRESEKAFEGNGMVAGVKLGEFGRWTCRVESQEAEMTRECSLL